MTSSEIFIRDFSPEPLRPAQPALGGLSEGTPQTPRLRRVADLGGGDVEGFGELLGGDVFGALGFPSRPPSTATPAQGRLPEAAAGIEGEAVDDEFGDFHWGFLGPGTSSSRPAHPRGVI